MAERRRADERAKFDAAIRERHADPVQNAKPGPGAMERAVRSELDGINARLAKDAGSASLAEGAMILARALDSFSASAESAAQLSAIVKANQELRATLAALRKAGEGVGNADDDRFAAEMSTAVGDAAQP
jgi:hypothetical protein